MAVESPPIIIKKIKKRGHGHHGGAWKVAFADFVTAMMAFFMLMWLMGSTTPQQKEAISEYMNNPLAATGQGGAGANPVLTGGSGILDGRGPSAFAQAAPTETPGPTPPSTQTNGPNTGAPSVEDAAEIAAQAERARLKSLLDELKAAVDANESLKPFKDQLLLDITSEGLRIQIVDKENRAMFAQGSPVLENYMRELLHEIVKVINDVPNRISISGHTDRAPYASNNGYSNWELSSDRANAARRELIVGGLPESKIGRVVGLASSVLFDKDNPFGPINRRISIIVMNKAADDAVNEGEGKAAVIDESKLAPKEATAKTPIPSIADEVKAGNPIVQTPLSTAELEAAAPPKSLATAADSVAPQSTPATDPPTPEAQNSAVTPPAPVAEPAPPPKPKKIVKIAARL
ncbi:MAG: flagellar motor protein MotB [Gammaproteobacteria bacterium]|nr:flagellar motor protein MotB [Gammaproteobacteria bacterium]